MRCGAARRHVRAASRRRPGPRAQPVGAVSIPRRATRLRFRHPGDRHESVGDGACGHRASHRRAARISARAAFAAATRGRLAGGRCPRRGHGHPGARRTGLLCVWEADELEVDRPRRRGAALVHRSPLPGAGAAALGSDDPLPRCRQTVHRGVGHPWLTGDVRDWRPTETRPTAVRDVAETPIADEACRPGSTPGRLPIDRAAIRRPSATSRLALALTVRGWQVRRGRPDRGRRGGAAVRQLPAVRLVVRGVRRLRAAGVGADQEPTTAAGGFGYGLLFGLAFYVPLLPWISGLVGAVPWLALSPAGGAVPGGVRTAGGRRAQRLPGWPVWFAAVWAVAGVAEVDRAVRRIPLGRSRFRPDRRPAAAARAARRRAAGVVRGGVGRLQPGRHRARDRALVARGTTERRRAAPPAVVLPGVCISLVLLTRRAGRPARAQVRRGRRRRPAASPWRRCRATCRGWAWSSTPSAARCSTTTCARRCGWPRTSGPGAQPQPVVVIWPENSSDIDPLRQRRRREQISAAAEAIGAPILVGAVLAAPGYTRDNPASTNTVIVWDGATGPGGTPRQADHPAVRRVPAVARLLPAPVVVRRPGRLLRARQTATAWCTPAGMPDRGHHLLGGHLRPGARANRSSTAPSCWRSRPTTPPSTRR